MKRDTEAAVSSTSEDSRHLALRMAVQVYAVDNETGRDQILPLAARFEAYLDGQDPTNDTPNDGEGGAS